MTPKRPYEVAQASKDIYEAWDKYDAFVESGDQIGAKIAWEALGYIEERYGSMYRQWQVLGGTSDIETIALFSKAQEINQDYDFTPTPQDMPDIDLNTIEEIPL